MAERSAGSLMQINDNNYIFGMSGLQIVVYDKAISKVADRVCFDLVLNKTIRREDLDL